MSQYGATQNTPYTGQQDSNLVENPRYRGQSIGTSPQGITGPQQESRYGAAPLNNTGTQQPQQSGTGQGGYQPTGGYGANTNPQSGYGTHTTSGYGGNINPHSGYGSQPTGGYGTERAAGMVDPNTHPSESGYGSQPTGGYGTHQQGDGFAREQPGYGQPGFGVPSAGQNTGALWPEPAPPPNAHKHDLTSQGQGPYGEHHHGQGVYGQQPQSGQGLYDQTGGYGQPPRKEGIKDKVKDAIGIGPQSHGTARGQGYSPNANHPSETTGFGGGLGHHPQGGQDQLGGGYNTGLATGADAYTQSQPRHEGVVGRAEDAVGVGPNSGYDARTRTGNDAYVHGNHPVGQQDRVQGVNEPALLGGEHGVHVPGGRSDGERVPQSLTGETRTEPGYDSSKGNLPGQGGHHQKLGETGLAGVGGHHNTRTDTTGIDERRGKGFEDTDDPYGSKLTTGTGTGTGTGTKIGADAYGDETTATGTGSGLGSGYDDLSTGSAPPKKGLISKIKEKMLH